MQMSQQVSHTFNLNNKITYSKPKLTYKIYSLSVCCENNILCQTLKNNLKKRHFEKINVSLLCLAFINEMGSENGSIV